MAGYSPGGFIPARSKMWLELDDSECLLNPQGQCIRNDSAHLREGPYEVLADDQVLHQFYGGCLHRACHVVPVESGDEVVALLCTACDTQLEA